MQKKNQQKKIDFSVYYNIKISDFKFENSKPYNSANFSIGYREINRSKGCFFLNYTNLQWICNDDNLFSFNYFQIQSWLHHINKI